MDFDFNLGLDPKLAALVEPSEKVRGRFGFSTHHWDEISSVIRLKACTGLALGTDHEALQPGILIHESILSIPQE